MPNRADKVLNKIRETHGGHLHDFRPGVRMRGEGNIADIIREQFQLARRRFFEGRVMPPFNVALHEQHKSPQLRLF
jgi:hypothetical protein